MPFNFKEIVGIQVFLEKNNSNELVGELTLKTGEFDFVYDNAYLHSPTAISLGPEMPLTRRTYHSTELFRPFVERIPSHENPAFPEYCKSAGISPDETNPLVLLSTIGSRGPSSFLFKPIYLENFTGLDLKKFRKHLGLSVREFAICFDFSPPGITRVETGKSDGREILKRVEIYALYPKVALDQLQRRSPYLHQNKAERAKSFLKSNLSALSEA